MVLFFSCEVGSQKLIPVTRTKTLLVLGNCVGSLQLFLPEQKARRHRKIGFSTITPFGLILDEAYFSSEPSVQTVPHKDDT